MLDELAGIIVLGGDGLFHLPIMAQGGDGLAFGLLALGAGQEPGAGERAGGGSRTGFLPVMDTGGGRIFRAGAFYDIVDVIDRIALLDGDILIPIGDGGGFPAFKSEGIGAVRIVIGPICDRLSLTCSKYYWFRSLWWSFFYFCDLPVVPYDAVVSA